MIYKKSILGLLFIFVLVSLVLPKFAHAKSCESVFQSKKVFFTTERKKKYLKVAITVPLFATMGILAWQKIDEKIFWPSVESKMVEQTLQVTEKNKKMYDDLLINDFRFKDVNLTKPDYDAIKLNSLLSSHQTQKRVLAYNLQQNYLSYYQRYRQIEHPNQMTLEQNIEKFGEDPLFRHLNFFFQNGSLNNPIVINDQQKNKLFFLTHKLYTRYALIDLAFAKGDPTALNKSNEIKKILKEPYTQQLFELERHNKINRTQVVYFLQEDAYHSYYFSIFETLKIKESVTLDDLRKERVMSHPRLPRYDDNRATL